MPKGILNRKQVMKAMRIAAAIAVAVYARAGNAGTLAPFESEAFAVQETPIDTRVLSTLEAENIAPAHPCSDAVFLRRAYLDVIGTLPTVQEVRSYLADENPDKRAVLIDALMDRDEFADYWSLKWGDILRVKSEFPINLWPNAVQAYHRWIRDAVKTNMPYDRFARALLTSSGSNFRVPPVNFYRAVQGREPEALAEAAALTFMGTRLDTWPADRRKAMAAFFSRIAYKKTGEWKEEIVCLNSEPQEPMDAVLPDGSKVRIPPEQDPRQVFANWLIAPENPWFARNIANRIWSWLMGRGIIHEPDDIRPDNPPANPELLAYLEKELIAAQYDLRHLFRLVLNSRTYQQSSIPRSDRPKAAALFAFYPVRRLDAEVLIDALCGIGGTGERYSSPIPEPFTFIPEYQRTIALADGSITSSFLEMFGRPTRDTGMESERNNQPSDAQRLYLLNSTDVQQKIERSPLWKQIFASGKRSPRLWVQSVYMGLLSRPPTPSEQAAALAYARNTGLPPKQAAEDLAWALINSKEFLYRH